MQYCVYYKFSGSKYIFLVLHIDDILLANNNIDLLYETKRFLIKKFEMKYLCDTYFVLGIWIHQDRFWDIFLLSEKRYIEKVLKKFDMQDCKSGDTSVSKGDKFTLSQNPKNDYEIK